MKLLSKLFLVVESALISSLSILYTYTTKIQTSHKEVTLLLSEEAKRILGQTEPYLKIALYEGSIIYPYQNLAITLLILAEWVGLIFFLYFIFKSKTKQEKRRARKKENNYAKWFLKKFPHCK